jgi:hypothetical protein
MNIAARQDEKIQDKHTKDIYWGMQKVLRCREELGLDR